MEASSNGFGYESKIDAKYTLVTVASKRARQLLAGAKKHIETRSQKPVTIAIEELGAGILQFQLYFQHTKYGLK